jgi:GNAT superfamily N-acetyltransferase
MVAEAILMGSTRDNLEVAWMLLWVDPEQRRRGFGSSLVEFMEDHARARGRKVLRAQVRVGDGLAGNRLFAERHGFTLAMTEIERRLTFPIDRARLDRLAAEAAPYHEGYEVRAFVGPMPPELRASYVEVSNLMMVEMPHGDLELEESRDTVENLDALDREREEAGRTAVTGVALHQGRVVAFADASVPSDRFTHVDQYGTLVHPDHRGHRLGMAVKCAQLRLLSERFPERAYIQTSNAEVNAHMVAINVALGFEIHQVWGEFEKRLSPDAPPLNH